MDKLNYTLEKLQNMMDNNCGNLYMSGTQITSLPENLTVGGGLDLSETQIKDKNKELRKVHILHDGDYVAANYLYADGILTHIKSKRKFQGYTYYVGKIKNKNVIQKGKIFAHCKSFKDGVRDIVFKEAADRGADQYSHLPPDSVLTADEAVTAYRIITGACKQGTESFVNSLGKLKDTYTVAEIIEKTRGQYGASTFAAFIDKNEG